MLLTQSLLTTVFLKLLKVIDSSCNRYEQLGIGTSVLIHLWMLSLLTNLNYLIWKRSGQEEMDLFSEMRRALKPNFESCCWMFYGLFSLSSSSPHHCFPQKCQNKEDALSSACFPALWLDMASCHCPSTTEVRSLHKRPQHICEAAVTEGNCGLSGDNLIFARPLWP